MSSLMASLTSAAPGRAGRVHSLPRMAANSSLDSEASCSSSSYRLSTSSSSSQVSLKLSEKKSVFWMILFLLLCVFLVTGGAGFSQ